MPDQHTLDCKLIAETIDPEMKGEFWKWCPSCSPVNCASCPTCNGSGRVPNISYDMPFSLLQEMMFWFEREGFGERDSTNIECTSDLGYTRPAPYWYLVKRQWAALRSVKPEYDRSYSVLGSFTDFIHTIAEAIRSQEGDAK